MLQYHGDDTMHKRGKIVPERDMGSPERSILLDVAERAARLGAAYIEAEYKDGFEEICAMRNGVGVGIARFPSAGAESAALRSELQAVVRKKRRVVIEGQECELHGQSYESFGETAFRIALRWI